MSLSLLWEGAQTPAFSLTAPLSMARGGTEWQWRAVWDAGVETGAEIGSQGPFVPQDGTWHSRSVPQEPGARRGCGRASGAWLLVSLSQQSQELVSTTGTPGHMRHQPGAQTGCQPATGQPRGLRAVPCKWRVLSWLGLFFQHPVEEALERNWNLTFLASWSKWAGIYTHYIIHRDRFWKKFAF